MSTSVNRNGEHKEDQKAAVRRRSRLTAGRRQRQLTRSILLASLALAAALYYFRDTQALDWSTLQQYIVLSLLGVGTLMLVALVASLIIRWLKR